jgi:hypothetical protein
MVLAHNDVLQLNLANFWDFTGKRSEFFHELRGETVEPGEGICLPLSFRPIGDHSGRGAFKLSLSRLE